VAIGALVFTSTVARHCTEIIRDIGGGFELTGACTGEITITGDPGGSGADTAELAAICIGYVPCADGMAGGGFVCAATGICGASIITTISSMDDIGGLGEGSGVLECTDIGCVLFTAIIKDTGAKCDHIGICGDATITTDVADGDGAVTVVLDITCTADASITDGLEQSGW